MAISATASKKETQFLWEGKDKRGNKVRGKSLATFRWVAHGVLPNLEGSSKIPLNYVQVGALTNHSLDATSP